MATKLSALLREDRALIARYGYHRRLAFSQACLLSCLGVGPSSPTRSQRLYRLCDQAMSRAALAKRFNQDVVHFEHPGLFTTVLLTITRSHHGDRILYRLSMALEASPDVLINQGQSA